MTWIATFVLKSSSVFLTTLSTIMCVFCVQAPERFTVTLCFQTKRFSMTRKWKFLPNPVHYSIHDGVRLVGVFTLVALSVDRYVASYYDLGRCRTTTVGRSVCAGIWLSFAAMTIPYWLYASVEPGSRGTGRRSCRVDWPDIEQTHPGRYAPSKLAWIRVCMSNAPNSRDKGALFCVAVYAG